MAWFARIKRNLDDAQTERILEGARVSKQDRLARTAKNRDLVAAISAVLFQADPIGINFETNTHEYDAEAETIVLALPITERLEEVRG